MGRNEDVSNGRKLIEDAIGMLNEGIDTISHAKTTPFCVNDVIQAIEYGDIERSEFPKILKVMLHYDLAFSNLDFDISDLDLYSLISAIALSLAKKDGKNPNAF